jgi:peptidoglycan/xylan/chitin deacetylase (PgdA/CDA1 family)
MAPPPNGVLSAAHQDGLAQQGSPAADASGPVASDLPMPSESVQPYFTPWPSGPPFTLPDWQPWPAYDAGGPAQLVSRGPRINAVAITIDDGNDPGTCRREFEFLRDNHLAATFFPTWVGVVKDKGLWQDIAAAGYPIGIHTLTHRDLTEPGIADHSIRRQLGGARSKIEAIIGRPTLPIFRPTYGHLDPRVLSIAGDLGLHTAVTWSTTSADTARNSKPQGMIDDALSGGRGAIILMHCNKPVSADILPAIAQGYVERGWQLVTLPELLRMNDAWVPGDPLPGDVPMGPDGSPLPASSPLMGASPDPGESPGAGTPASPRPSV